MNADSNTAKQYCDSVQNSNRFGGQTWCLKNHSRLNDLDAIDNEEQID